MTVKTSGACGRLLTIAVLSVLAAVLLAAQQLKFASLGSFQLEADFSPTAISVFLCALCALELQRAGPQASLCPLR